LCLDSARPGDSLQSFPIAVSVEPCGQLFVVKNSNIHLNCSASLRNGGLVQIKWRRDGLLVAPGKSRQGGSQLIVDNTGVLWIMGVARHNEGQYECIATQEINRIHRTIVSEPVQLYLNCEYINITKMRGNSVIYFPEVRYIS
jgi:Immunoglobulin domain